MTMKSYDQFITEARYAMRPPGRAYSKERKAEINYGVEREDPPKNKLQAIHYFKKADYSHVGKHGIEQIGKDSYGIKDYGKPQNKLHIASAEKALGEKSRRWEPKS